MGTLMVAAVLPFHLANLDMETEVCIVALHITQCNNRLATASFWVVWTNEDVVSTIRANGSFGIVSSFQRLPGLVQQC